MIYRIMIVEDEPPSVRAISHAIERIGTRLPIRIAACAQNGLDALEKIELTAVDIILCDVRMPVMDGFELMEQIHSRAPGIQSLFLTAYQDFSYMRKSLHLEMSDYLLKPLDESELEAALLRMIEKLDRAYQESMTSFLRDCVDSMKLVSYPEQRHHAYLVLSVNAGLYIDEEEASAIPASATLEPDALTRLLQHEFPDSDSWVLPTAHANKLTGISGFQRHEYQERISQALSRALPQLNTDTKITCTFTLVPQMTDIPEALKRTKHALIQRVIPGRTTIANIDTDSREPFPSILTPARIESLNEQLRLGQFGLFIENLEKWLLDLPLQRTTQVQLRHAIDKSISLVAQHVPCLSAEDRSQLEVLASKVMNVTSDAETCIKDFCSKLSYQLSEFGKRISSGTSTEAIINNVAAYLMSNYSQPLNLAVVAAKHGLSPQYLSAMYRRYRGTTPSKHIQTLRIARAKAIIANQPHVSFKQIAAEIGYSDPHYFSRLFRNTVGMTMSEYRDSL